MTFHCTSVLLGTRPRTAVDLAALPRAGDLRPPGAGVAASTGASPAPSAQQTHGWGASPCSTCLAWRPPCNLLAGAALVAVAAGGASTAPTEEGRSRRSASTGLPLVGTAPAAAARNAPLGPARDSDRLGSEAWAAGAPTGGSSPPPEGAPNGPASLAAGLLFREAALVPASLVAAGLLFREAALAPTMAPLSRAAAFARGTKSEKRVLPGGKASNLLNRWARNVQSLSNKGLTAAKGAKTSCKPL